MSQDLICESLIGFELEGIHNFCEALCELVTRDHCIASLYLIGRGEILAVIFGELPKSSTLDFFLNKMLPWFFNNMFFFEWHSGRRRGWCFILIIINKKLVRFSMMSPLLLHLYPWLPLRVFLETTLIRPPFLGLVFIIEFRLVSINPLKLFSILYSQAL